MRKVIGIEIANIEKFVGKRYADIRKFYKKDLPSRITIQSFLISSESSNDSKKACNLRIGDTMAYSQNNPPEVGDTVFQDSSQEERLRDGWYLLERRRLILIAEGRVTEVAEC